MALNETVTAELNLVKSTLRTRLLLHKGTRRSVKLTDTDNARHISIDLNTAADVRTIGPVSQLLVLDAEVPVTVSLRATPSDTPQLITSKFLVMFAGLQEVIVSTTSVTPVTVYLYWS